jgi:hypothetical protein
MTYKGTQRGQEHHAERGHETQGVDDAGPEEAGRANVNKESGGHAGTGTDQAHRNGATPESSNAHEKGRVRGRAERSEAAKRGWSTRRSKDAFK